MPPGATVHEQPQFVPPITDERGLGGPVAEPNEPVVEPRSVWRRVLGALIALGVLIFSYGSKALLILPKLKFATTGLSMLVSIGAYALIFTWRFAIGLVLLLLIHELGHVFQLRREGIKASAPLFIPFLGAAVAMKQLPRDAAAEARVGLAGPVLGTVGCLVPLALYGVDQNPLFLALTFVGLFLNLFNLLPVLPLDGGRAAQALSPVFTYIGLALLLALAYAVPNPIMFLILVFAAMETYRRFKLRKTPEAQRYQEVSARNRALIAAVYIALVVVLVVGMQLTFVPMEIGKEL
jgi:Zn-dependent protease